MVFDFGKIKPPKKEELITDPVALFQKNKSKITDKAINDLWLGQGDALREWDAHRKDEDVAVVLNTGAGKTLIGLLIAQSLVNETKGKVVYACGSIQLIEQTREKADGYGIPVTTYYSGNYSNDLFHQGHAACLTTYQAIFNGKSIFEREEIDAIIFDDAHTAEGIIKSQFSLEIDRDSNRDIYNSITALFREHYHKIGRSASFAELYDGMNRGVELLPPTIVRNNISEIARIFASSDLLRVGGNIFSWEYLKNHLDLCAFFISSGSIQIVPPFIPVTNIFCFQKGVRRVYLTATMLGDDAFLRTFGKELKHVVKPTTTAGECERLILFPGEALGFDDEILCAKEIVEKKKTLILTPSIFQARKWEDVGELADRGSIVKCVNEFKEATDNRKLILAGRYDGIDLPGDTCRYLILDELPTGSSLFDRYLWSSLNLSNVLRSLIACRVIQSLGRISRGMSDFGAVLVTGKDYSNWLKSPKNMASLPEFVQKQMHLGFQVTKSFGGIDGIMQAIETFMQRDSGWSTFYEGFMSECEIEKSDVDKDVLRFFAQNEIKFSQHYWDREYANAAKVLSDILDSAFEFSANLGAWYCLWLGYCLELIGDDSFHSIYRRAYGAAKCIPKHLPQEIGSSDTPFSVQITNIANEFSFGSGSNVALPKNMLANLSALDGNATVNQIEESIRFLGQYLGLNSTRPDKEQDIGPDNLWLLDDVALVIEAKTSKNEKVEYSKKYVGQLAQHINWTSENYAPESLLAIFIGPIIKATDSASPSDEMVVAPLQSLHELSVRVIAAYEDVAKRSIPITLAQGIQDVFSERKLLWPDLIDELNPVRLKDLA